VDFLTDVVACAMDEELPVAGLVDDVAGSLIDFPPGQRTAGEQGEQAGRAA